MSKKNKKVQTFTVNSANDNNEILNMILMPLSILLSGVLITVSVLYSANVILDSDQIVTKNNLRSVLQETLQGANLGTGGRGVTPTGPIENPAAKTNIGNSPRKGDANAKVVIVEYSDYQCPFCERHFRQTYPQIVSEYIDKGKVQMVFRDNPLPFHEPQASMQAMAALCVQDQAGDDKYYQYHDLLFQNFDSTDLINAEFQSQINQIQSSYKSGTISGDETRKQTLAIKEARKNDQLIQFANKIGGIDIARFTNCVETDAFREKLEENIVAASKAGASGTPGFVIGIVNDEGVVVGELVSGALLYSEFRAVFEKYLAQV
jgi:protein-disulfide isomerase